MTSPEWPHTWKRSPTGKTWHWVKSRKALCGVELPPLLRLFASKYKPDNDVCHNCLRLLGDPRE